MMKSKNPIFLESVNLDEKGQINLEQLNTVASDYDKFIDNHLFAVQETVFEKKEGMVSLKEGFETIQSWIKSYYGV